jgi:L-aspartate oxidase
LASNGLLEALVFARNAAEDISNGLQVQFAPEVDVDFKDGGQEVDEALVAKLRQAMTSLVGVRRHADGLKQALTVIAECEAAQPDNPTVKNMTATATLIAAAALERRESRGGHFRDDFPDQNEQLAARTFMTLTQAMTIRDSV